MAEVEITAETKKSSATTATLKQETKATEKPASAATAKTEQKKSDQSNSSTSTKSEVKPTTKASEQKPAATSTKKKSSGDIVSVSNIRIYSNPGLTGQPRIISGNIEIIKADKEVSTVKYVRSGFGPVTGYVSSDIF